MMVTYRSSGFALLAVIGVMAVITALALALLQLNLSNVRTAVWESRTLQAQHLLDSGLRYAALSIASPRIDVAPNAMPLDTLVYRNPIAEVRLNITNEAGRIDLLNADPALVDAALIAAGADAGDAKQIRDALVAKQSLADQVPIALQPDEVRRLRLALAGLPVDQDVLWNLATIANGKMTINPELASAAVLARIPSLSSAEQAHILDRRREASIRAEGNNSIDSLINNGFKTVENPHFGQNISSFYRIRAEVIIADQVYTKMWLVKMVNQHEQLFEVFSHW